METKQKNTYLSVFSGSYMDSLFVSYYLHNSGIESHLENLIKGTEKLISPCVFPGTKVIVSKRKYKMAVKLISDLQKRREN